MIKPKQISLQTMDGDTREYTISRIPAVQAREIVSQYPVSAVPKIGDYKVNEAMMLKILSYVTVTTDAGTELALTNKTLIDNHVPDWETLARIEMAMVEYNTSFFSNGKSSSFFENIGQKAQVLITKTLTDLLAQSSQGKEPPSTN
jgi:hypothetical protein